MGRTVEPGWGVDMMMEWPASSVGRAETGVDMDAGESAWTFGEGCMYAGGKAEGERIAPVDPARKWLTISTRLF